LCEPGVVEILRTSFVPVAIDLRIDEHREPLQPGSEAAVQAQAERKLLKAWGGLDQHRPIGLHVVLPDGKVIAKYDCRWVASGEKPVSEMVDFLKGALYRTGPVSERQVEPKPLNPDRGTGSRPDGSIRLAVVVRALEGGKAINHRPVFESAYLSATQLKALAPPEPKLGVRYTIAEEVARQFTTVLTDDGDDVFTIRPKEATVVQLQADVVAICETRIEVQISGDLAGKRSSSERIVAAQAKVQGLLTFNRKQELQSVLIVTDGLYRSPWAQQAHTVGGVLEWQLAPPANAANGKGR
jgi:hypothetical protein